MTELRNLQATGLTTIGHSLRTAFDLLNLNRLVTGIDNYGQVCSSEEEQTENRGFRKCCYDNYDPIPPSDSSTPAP